MPKNDTAVADEVQAEAKITLVEFCTRLSETITRPELIGGFEHVEKRAGRLKDTAAAFRQRFDAFVNTPV